MDHHDRARRLLETLEDTDDREEWHLLFVEQFKEVETQAKTDLVMEGAIEHCKRLCPGIADRCGLDYVKKP